MLDLGSFLSELECIPWFANIGQPLEPTLRVRRIGSWEDWMGPEDESSEKLAQRHQQVHDELAAAEGAFAERIAAMLRDQVIRTASARVPFKPEGDPWDPPNAAVWQAAWTAGLVGTFRLLEREVPPDIQEQWDWFRAGRWPCGIEDPYEVERLIVF